VKVLDLFSGIGGFSLGLERAGMETVAFCEFDKKAQLVLKKHWPDVPIFDDVREKMTVTSGLNISGLYKRSSPVGLLVKMLLISPIWESRLSIPIWKVSTTMCKRLIFRLTPLVYQRWNGTCGLLPRPTASDAKGASAKRFRTSPHNHGNFREMIRETLNDGQYPNPEFVEWVKGFPAGWTDLNS
jgi:hypothetical protein